MSAYTDILLQFAKAFAVGGAVCTVAQVIINCTKLTSCRILVMFLLSGVVLGALGLYDYLVDLPAPARPCPSAASAGCSRRARCAGRTRGCSAR